MAVTIPNDKAEVERAFKAVREFYKMMPTISGFVEALAGRRMPVSVSTNGSTYTDGRGIWIVPPLELGDEPVHDRPNCYKRNGKRYACVACHAYEQVLFRMYHEVGHNTYGSFETMRESELASLVEWAIKDSGRNDKFGEALIKRIDSMPEYLRRDYAAVTAQISPFLKSVMMAIEEIRINAEVFRARPGLRSAYEAFIEDHREPDTSPPDEHLNGQVVFGLMDVYWDRDFTEYFDPRVVKALRDPELQQLVKQIGAGQRAGQSLTVGYEVLRRLRELGFLRSDADPEDETEGTGGEESPSGGDGDTDETAPADDDGQPEGDATDGGSPPDQTDESQDDEESAQGADESGADDSPDDDGVGSEPDDAEPDVDQEGPVSDTDDGPTDPESGDADSGQSEDSPEDEAEGSSADGGSTEDSPTPDEGDDDPGVEGEGDPGEQSPVQEDGDANPDSLPDPVDAPEEAGEDAGSDGGDSESGGDGDVEGEDGTTDQTSDGDQADGDDASESGSDEDDPGTEEPAGDAAEPQAGEGDIDVPSLPEAGDMGNEQDVLAVLAEVVHDPVAEYGTGSAPDLLILLALSQALNFDTAAHGVNGIQFNEGVGPGFGYRTDWRVDYFTNQPEKVSEADMGLALRNMRIAFAENDRTGYIPNQKKGRVDPRVLGRRAWSGDARLFEKRVNPKKRSYFVVIGLDCSGSTGGGTIHDIKIAALAQAELCHRMGISFAVYSHSGQNDLVQIGVIKAPEAPWDTQAVDRLYRLKSFGGNLDGHTLEFYRKVAEARTETDRIIMYYTDGAMPAANYHEELAVLQRNIKICQQQGITLMGVGLGTDSPVQHGLDTVQVDSTADIPRVVKHLEGRLLSR